LAQTATVALDTLTLNCLKSVGSPQVAQVSITIRVETLETT
jgi:hypothetical protein